MTSGSWHFSSSASGFFTRNRKISLSFYLQIYNNYIMKEYNLYTFHLISSSYVRGISKMLIYISTVLNQITYYIITLTCSDVQRQQLKRNWFATGHAVIFGHILEFRCVIWQGSRVHGILKWYNVDYVFPIIWGGLQHFGCVSLGTLWEWWYLSLTTASFEK